VEWRLLAGIPASDIRELLSVARRRRFARNEVVFHADDPGDSLHLIEKGRFSIRVMTPLGAVATLAVRGPGEAFGELALVDPPAKRSATVTALEEAETFAVYREEFDRLRRRHASINNVLVQVLGYELRTMNALLLEALYVPVEKRVVRRLVDLAAIYPADDGRPLITLTQEALSELAGASRATVNQVLRDEEKRGTIELHRGRTRVLDLETLAKRAR
jgi:CRP/FNR family cyclic AMP-dependent transcriptional regulator